MSDNDKINNLTPLARPDPDDSDAMSIHAPHAPSSHTNFVHGLVPFQPPYGHQEGSIYGLGEPLLTQVVRGSAEFA